jgi:hypothetical protein
VTTLPGVGVEGVARFSDDGVYRYELRRRWGDGPLALWCGLNPSTADADHEDPTTRRIRGFSEREGMGGYVLVNLFAYRATDPNLLPLVQHPIGLPENRRTVDMWLHDPAVELVVAAWGAFLPRSHRQHPDTFMVSAVGADRQVMCLGETKSGAPRHPLYIRKDARLVPYRHS